MANSFYNNTYAGTSFNLGRASHVNDQFVNVKTGFDTLADVTNVLRGPAKEKTELPLSANRANRLLMFDSSGSPSMVSRAALTDHTHTQLALLGRSASQTLSADGLLTFDTQTFVEGGAYTFDYVRNGIFASDTLWTKGTGWTISSGVATKTAGSEADLTQTPLELTNGARYKVTFTVTAITAGSVAVVLGDGTAGTGRSATGTYSEIIRSGSGNDIDIRGNSLFAGSVDNLIVVPIIIGNFADTVDEITVVPGEWMFWLWFNVFNVNAINMDVTIEMQIDGVNKQTEVLRGDASSVFNWGRRSFGMVVHRTVVANEVFRVNINYTSTTDSVRFNHTMLQVMQVGQ